MIYFFLFVLYDLLFSICIKCFPSLCFVDNAIEAIDEFAFLEGELLYAFILFFLCACTYIVSIFRKEESKINLLRCFCHGLL